MMQNVEPNHACANFKEWTGPREHRLHEALQDPSVDVRTFMALIVDYSRMLVRLKMRAAGVEAPRSAWRGTKAARIYDAFTEPH